MSEQQKKAQQEPDLNQLRKVRREKLADLQANGKDPFVITKYDQTHHSLEIKENFEELAGKEVSIAGRMMSKRVMGKASFCNVQDLQGNIQSYVARDSIGEEAYKEFKKMDVGDVIGITGEVFETKTGEKSIHASSVTLLSKSLQILPEKFHGLTNTDIRYRQRYVDLIMNPDVKQTFINRSKILSAIRRYLDGQGFLEVETPMLVSNAGGAAARPFETHFNALDEDFKLRISLELYLKRLIVGGMERVYEIGRVFRNEGLDTRHNPEFTLMELYQAYTDYNGMMDLTENLYRHVAQEVLGTTVIEYNGVQMDLGKPFEKIMDNRTVSEEEAKKTAQMVGLAAIKYGDLSNQASKDYVFDVDRFTSFEGNTGPYILYTIVRIKSILNKYQEENSLEDLVIREASSEFEKALMLECAKFNDVIETVYEETAPHKLCAYIYDLANAFNKFYHETKILSEEDAEKKKGYIALLKLTKEVLESCIDLLGFEAPERM